MGDIRTKQIDRVLEFMQRTPDELITLQRVVGSLGLPNADSTSGCLNRIVSRYPNAERVSRGVYRWNSVVKDSTPQVAMPDEMIIRVVARRDGGKVLVVDVDSEKLYIIQEFDF